MKAIRWILYVVGFCVVLGGILTIAHALLSKSWVWAEHGLALGVSVAVFLVCAYSYEALKSRVKQESKPEQEQETE